MEEECDLDGERIRRDVYRDPDLPMDSLGLDESAIEAMRGELKQLLADALRVAAGTRADTDRVADKTSEDTDRLQHLHDDEMSAAQKAHSDKMTAVQEQHDDEMLAEQHTHEDQMHNMERALASRDVFGQAKGIIMITMHCDANKAFELIRKQSQAENRKALEVAAEIVARVSRRAAE